MNNRLENYVFGCLGRGRLGEVHPETLPLPSRLKSSLVSVNLSRQYPMAGRPVNYRVEPLWVVSPDGKGRTRLDDCCVVGKSAEHALKLAYRPEVGRLPIPLPLQRAADLEILLVSQTRQDGRPSLRPVSVRVPPSVATLALRVATEAVQRLQGPPYNLEVLSVDHSGPSSCPVAHDLLMCPNMAGRSSLEQGVHSVELKCREVVSRTAFDWEWALTSEAMPLFAAEVAKDSRLIRSRVLVFAELPRPCLSGAPPKLHGSILRAGHQSWERLWGWEGFRRPPALAKAPPEAKPKPSPLATLTAEQKWAILEAKLSVQDGRWVRMATFLERVRISKSHPERYLTAGHKKCWVLGRRRKPRPNKDFLKRKGHRGGGDGGGIFYASLEFLKEVFVQFYAPHWNP